MSQVPFSVKECNIGSGALCGAIFLHKNFKELLRHKLGTRANSILTERKLKEAMSYFENSVKRAFNPYDETCEPDFDVPLGNTSDILSIGLEDGYLRLSMFEVPVVSKLNDRDDIKGVFLPIFEQIHDLITQQMRDVEAKGYGKLKVYVYFAFI